MQKYNLPSKKTHTKIMQIR